MDIGGVDWLQRLYQWFRSVTHRQREIGPVSPYGTWDAQGEHFRPIRADSAVDLVASQNGVAWAERIYSACV
jgi:hypothetical protein